MKDNDIREEDKELLLDHDYDGIQELDYPLPRWWLVTFYGTVIFGIFYFYHYSIADGVDLKQAYGQDIQAHKKTQQAYLEQLSKFDSEKFKSHAKTPEMVGLGKALYEQNCQSCHNQNAAGDIGPNLTDAFWLYAEGTPKTIYPFIIKGNPEGGMPAWGEYLDEDEIYSVLAYIISLQGMAHDKKKEPQGEEFPLYKVE